MHARLGALALLIGCSGPSSSAVSPPTPPSTPPIDAGLGAGPPDAAAIAATCPDEAAAPPRDQTSCASQNLTCRHGRTSCTCARQCSGGAMVQVGAPIPGLVWHCREPRTDGCPNDPPSGACTLAGQECQYMVGGCQAAIVTCASGTWIARQGPPPP
jgi:hypothetical protein